MTISATSTTAEVYAADIFASWDTVDSAWTALDLPSTFTDFVDTYTDGTDDTAFTAFIDILGFDLTDFFTDCATSDYCDDYFYENRYDGLAMVHYASLTFEAPASGQAEISSALALCIEEDAQCIGWLMSLYYNGTHYLYN
jgi:hypothetical protein